LVFIEFLREEDNKKGLIDILALEEFTTIAKVACPGTNNIESNEKQM
jgi:hypothetical protein